ncbi:MAG: alpha/beta hydrolase-fold protein, partial [Verrucomicrobiota bacterium]
MSRRLFSGLLFIGVLCSHAEEESYPIHPDMVEQEGVPRGAVQRGVFDASEVFPGTVRDFAVYIPAQYNETEPAALMVFQDGISYLKSVPTMLDNLIHTGDMPVTVALFANPGVVPEFSDKALARYNRSFEYDAADGRYASFLLEEMIPASLRELNITEDPNLRALCGSSSGGMAAFMVAWERSDQFRRVY